MSPLDKKHFWAFVVKTLLFCGVLPESSGDKYKLNGINIANIRWSLCPLPKGFSKNISEHILSVQGNTSDAAICKTKIKNCNIMTLLLGSSVSGLSLNPPPDNDVVVIKQLDRHNNSALILTKTGYCWNKDVNVNNILCDQNIRACSGLGNVITIDLTTTVNCVQSQPPSTTTPHTCGHPSGQGDTHSNFAVNLMKNLSSCVSSSGTQTITSGNITGVLVKLQRATNLKVSITRDATKVIADSIVGTDLYCLVDIPAEVSSMAVNKNGTVAAVVLFPDSGQIDPNSVFLDNRMIAIEMGAEINNLSQPVKLQYYNVDKKGNVASCVSWNGTGDPTWTTDGCYLNETNSSITCECTHLTFFALLMSPPPTNISASDYRSLTYITSVGCGLSMFFLAVALFMHCLIRKGKASQGTKILMNLFVAMFGLDLSFLVNESIADLGNLGACVGIAAVMHYSMLATFSWFFVEALHINLNMRRSLSEVKHYMIKIGIMGWGTPAVVVIVLLVMQKYGQVVINGGSASKMCWMSDAVIHRWLNVGYYAVVFIFTIGVFIATVRQVVLFKPAVGKAQHSISVKSKTFTILGLLLLLGITWAFAFFSYGPLLIPSYYIFTILNSFQGFFLFIYYYNTSKLDVGDRSLKDKESTVATSNTFVNPCQ